jgi:hypothetical protein
MSINKRFITILIATLVLSIPAIYIKNQVFAQSPPEPTEPRFEVMLASTRAEQEEQAKKDAQAAAEAAQLAEAQRVEQERIAAEQAQAEAQRVAAEQEAERVRVAQEAAAANCGPADPAYIYRILVESGVPRLSAIQQLGSWKSESKLDPCQKIGDGGIAWGLNSWHPGRRADMPINLKEQVLWAVHTEMKRDCAQCYEVFMSPGQSVNAIRTAIQQSTRWGVEGARWTYANQFNQMF